MGELLSLPVTFQDQEMEFQARFYAYGYIHRIEVRINGLGVIFEPDEERNYRALLTAQQLEANLNTLNKELLQAIAQQLQSLSGGLL
ncbi:hypothetical protein PQ469_12190 [Mucilaginibacter sp. KACC 22773]|uniref:hypothetical protein n=1 Tax=Mucilaginibacter sp. KACC 22773 TaxID=3025671 RepID=UPI0023670C2A|nr:hypothetical protein [Mucilaginibacter sp. KACC 22773]WDF80767.1 hypothetical protein PQ469_12190 [Mucilaginibacter sp. KACC 22773]